MKPGTGFAALSVFLLVVGGVARGAGENHRESLRGLTGVSVRVERLSGSANQDGLDARLIQTDAEQKLKKAGIAVLTAAQAAQEPGSPVLYISVNARLPYNSAPYALMITVAVLQDVVSARDPNLKLREVKTWDAGYLTALDPSLLKQARTMVGDLVDEFVNDWRSVNQK
jgi:hypothetical protein